MQSLRRVHPHWLGLVAAILALPSCGRIDDATRPLTDAALDVADAPVDLATICREWSVAYCHAEHVCSPAAFEQQMGEESACRTHYAQDCIGGASLPGILVADYVASQLCWTSRVARPDFVCRGYFSLFDLSRTTIPCEGETGHGTLANGSQCELSLQCASGHCDSPLTGCGTCADPVPVTLVPLGAMCDDFHVCESGTACRGTCRPIADRGESCIDAYCRYEELVCRDGTCVDWSHVGEPCSGPGDCIRGAGCDPVTKRCTPIPFLPAGAPCDPHSRDAAPIGDVCVHGFRCMSGRSGGPTCAPLPGLGEPCGDTGGSCQWPLGCVDGTCGEPVPVCL